MSEEKQQEATTDVKSDAAIEPITAAKAKKDGDAAAPEKVPATDAPAATRERAPRGPRARRGGNDRRGGQGGRRPRRGGRQERVKPEFDQKIISIRRVTRVMAGGRRFSFSFSMVIETRKEKLELVSEKQGILS